MGKRGAAPRKPQGLPPEISPTVSIWRHGRDVCQRGKRKSFSKTQPLWGSPERKAANWYFTDACRLGQEGPWDREPGVMGSVPVLTLPHGRARPQVSLPLTNRAEHPALDRHQTLFPGGCAHTSFTYGQGSAHQQMFPEPKNKTQHFTTGEMRGRAGEATCLRLENK